MGARRRIAARGGLPSSAGRDHTASADEDASRSLPDEELIQLADGEGWPAHFGAARLGIP
jgi:hypothetical protein